jgi:hypothetical protein
MPIDPTPDTRLSVLEVHMKNVTDRMDTIEHRLFGNGQPGMFEKIDGKLDRVVSDISTKIDTVRAENAEQRVKFAKLAGYLAGAGLIAASAYKALF